MNELKAVLSGVFQISADRVADDLELEDVPGWDSMLHMELVVALENRYDIRFTFEEIAGMTDVPSIRSTLRGKGAL